MAHIYGSRLKRKIQVRNINMMALFVFLAYAIFLLWAYLKSQNYLFIITLWIPILGFAVILSKKYFSFEKLIYQGIKLESSILKNLKKLPEEYSVMQHVFIGHELGDIDFVVIGPKGIFAIETKVENLSRDTEKALLARTLTLQDLISVHTGHTIFVEPIIIQPQKPHQYTNERIKLLEKEEISSYILFQPDSLLEKERMKVEGEVFRHMRKTNN